MRYFCRSWDESRGDEHDAWGTSVWYFETDMDFNVTRQLERYKSGVTTTYCEDHIEDEYGGLSKRALDPADFVHFEINESKFSKAWAQQKPFNR